MVKAGGLKKINLHKAIKNNQIDLFCKQHPNSTNKKEFDALLDIMCDPPLLLIQIETAYACAGIMADAGVVVNAAPIYKWMIGKKLSEVRQWKKIKQWHELPV